MDVGTGSLYRGLTAAVHLAQQGDAPLLYTPQEARMPIPAAAVVPVLVPSQLAQRPMKFQSAGQHHFGVHEAAVYGPAAAPPLPLQASPRRQAEACSSTNRHPELDATNVGHQLLTKAGWQVGTGLGATEQGRTAPIEPAPQQGCKGIGFAADRRRGRDSADGDGARGASTSGAQGAPAEPTAEERARAEAVKASQRRVKAVLAAEQAAESQESKVLRHRQVARQEADDARGHAIRRYITKAFNDPFDNVGSDDCNPLTRRTRLTATNPLLD